MGVFQLKVLTIYFSQTGGTKKIAEMIEEGIINSGNQCDCIPLKEVKVSQLDVYDIIGLGCPTFFYREPRNVRLFIQTLPKKTRQHSFIFATHGSCLGNTFVYLNEELSERGYLVIGCFDSYSDSSLQFYPSPMHTAGHPDALELEGARQFGRNLCALSQKIHQGDTSLIPCFRLITDTWWYRDSQLMTLDILRKISPKFTINQEQCTRCMICQDDCPGDAINLSVSPPEIQTEGCIFCWACEKKCPASAIEADWTLMRVSARNNLRKYVALLKTAEAEGKFRPHIDYQKIK